MPFLDQANRAHDLAWGAEPALEAVMGDESGLDGMEFAAARDTLDRENVGAVVADRQCQARIDPSSVDQDRARAALAAVASLLGSRQIETLTQEIEESDPWVSQLDVPPYTVHGEADGEIHAVLRSVLSSNWIAAVARAAQRGSARGAGRGVRRWWQEERESASGRYTATSQRARPCSKPSIDARWNSSSSLRSSWRARPRRSTPCVAGCGPMSSSSPPRRACRLRWRLPCMARRSSTPIRSIA